MLIVKATEADARDIWAWRNDSATRAMSVSGGVVSLEAHLRWYHDTLANPNRLLFMGKLSSGDKVGMCRFDIDPVQGHAEVSINLNPEMRGKKLSAALLSAAIQTFWQAHELPLRATIRKNNAPSLRLFTGCGFVLAGEDGAFLHYLLKP